MAALRWEWRTFGDRFGAAEKRLGSTELDGVTNSAEIYLLAAQSLDAVKVATD